VVRKTVIRKNRYLDSVFLMEVARRLAAQPGIRDASALLATEANRKVLAAMGYGEEGRDAEFAAAGPNDLVLALEGEAPAVAAIAASAESWLSRGSHDAAGSDRPAPGPRSIAEAVARRPDTSLAVISVPGEHAAREARAALRAGLHVFLFSSNVSVEDERSLKLEAQERGLIVMGPDCGTGLLGGAGIGFANAVRRGHIGVVGSTGTGLQEFSSLVHQAGAGISSGIGTGSRDLSDAIGGLSTMVALDALEADPATQVIAVLSKPPGEAAATRLLGRLARCAKPVVLCLLGAEPGLHGGVAGAPGAVQLAATIDEAVALALSTVGVRPPSLLRQDLGALRELVSAELGRMRPEQRHVRGLFAGGTLCYQAQAVCRAAGLVVRSNAPLRGMLALSNPEESREDTFLDLGAELFVQGRPHPMIDSALRRKRLEQEGEDPTVAVVLLDFVLGAIASRDPVGDLRGAILGAQAAARRRAGHLCVVASVCGTDDDAQGLQAQTRALVEAGVQVFPSSAQAAAFCLEAMLRLAGGKEAGPWT
jgi:FdrA protein